MTISSEHPFLPPESDRSPVRRLRGRLPSPVTVWTAGAADGRAGLTVSSLLVADGQPGFVAGVLDPLSELWDALRASGSAVVNLLGWQHRQLADAFGYVAPAPGGPFRLAAWTETEWGPALAGAPAGPAAGSATGPESSWAGVCWCSWRWCTSSSGEDQPPLIHRRGRYRTLPGESPAG